MHSILTFAGGIRGIGSRDRQPSAVGSAPPARRGPVAPTPFALWVSLLACVVATARGPVLVAASLPTIPSAAQVLSNQVELIGGREAWGKHNSIHLKGTWDVPGMGLSGPLNIYRAKPNKYLLKADVPGFESQVGFDGQVGWSSNAKLGPDPQLLEGQPLAQLRLEADFFSDVAGTNDLRSAVNAGMAQFEGKSCYKLNVVTKAGVPLTAFFDQKTGLAAGVTLSIDAPQGKIPLTVIVAEHRQFGGLLFATKITRRTAGIQEVMRITSVEFDKVPDSVFAAPAAVKAKSLLK